MHFSRWGNRVRAGGRWISCVRSAARMLIMALALGIVVPIAAVFCWTQTNRYAEERAKESGDWPCNPWGSRSVRGVGRLSYHVYYYLTIPGRTVLMQQRRCDQDIVRRIHPRLAYWSGAKFSWDSLTRLGQLAFDWPFYAAQCMTWLALLGLMELLGAVFFSKRRPRWRRYAGWWVVGALVGCTTAVVVALRTLMGFDCGVWNWPLVATTLLVGALQLVWLRKASLADPGHEAMARRTWVRRLDTATWLLAAVNGALWVILTPW